MTLIKSLFAMLLIAAAVPALANSFFDLMRIEAREAVEMTKSSDHYTREKGYEKLEKIDDELDRAADEGDHYTRELVFDLKREIQDMKN